VDWRASLMLGALSAVIELNAWASLLLGEIIGAGVE
jgi:hypothetical protein